MRLFFATAFLLVAGAYSAQAQAPANSVYATKCQMCHGATGRADTPAGKALAAHAFNDPAVVKLSDAELIAVIKSGKGKMPAFNGKISAGDITGLVPVIRGFQK